MVMTEKGWGSYFYLYVETQYIWTCMGGRQNAETEEHRNTCHAWNGALTPLPHTPTASPYYGLATLAGRFAAVRMINLGKVNAAGTRQHSGFHFGILQTGIDPRSVECQYGIQNGVSCRQR